MSYAWIPLAACLNQTWSSSCASNACVQRHRTRPTGRSRRSHSIHNCTLHELHMANLPRGGRQAVHAEQFLMDNPVLTRILRAEPVAD
eukprot:5147823-Pleurochrysis_carterae.AAC.1